MIGQPVATLSHHHRQQRCHPTLNLQYSCQTSTFQWQASASIPEMIALGFAIAHWVRYLQRGHARSALPPEVLSMATPLLSKNEGGRKSQGADKCYSTFELAACGACRFRNHGLTYSKSGFCEASSAVTYQAARSACTRPTHASEGCLELHEFLTENTTSSGY